MSPSTRRSCTPTCTLSASSTVRRSCTPRHREVRSSRSGSDRTRTWAPVCGRGPSGHRLMSRPHRGSAMIRRHRRSDCPPRRCCCHLARRAGARGPGRLGQRAGVPGTQLPEGPRSQPTIGRAAATSNPWLRHCLILPHHAENPGGASWPNDSTGRPNLSTASKGRHEITVVDRASAHLSLPRFLQTHDPAQSAPAVRAISSAAIRPTDEREASNRD
jgi:hypothetical protein